MHISSTSNPRVKTAARLRERQGRDQQQRIIIDGVREIRRALEGGVRVLELYSFPELCRDEEHQAVLQTAGARGAHLFEVTPAVMEKLAYGKRVEGIVAVASPPRRTLSDLVLPADAVVAVVEGVEKPGNLGAILRTADAAGLAALIVASGGTDLYNPNAIRASLGAIFTVPVCSAASQAAFDWLQQENFRLLAARVDAGIDYTTASYHGRVAIVLGSEAEGLTPLWQGEGVTAVRLPMLGRVDSLNLSATAAVLFYEAWRQRRGANHPERQLSDQEGRGNQPHDRGPRDQ
jgi:RNA methyltransferase, TrmH family